MLKLPDHLRQTYKVLIDQGEATATQIAEKTRRQRAVESLYLNQLTLMGLTQKSRSGREVLFKIK